MAFNHKQKLTALGHVIAFIAVLFIGYVSFLGLSYLRQGELMSSAILCAIYGAGLFLLCVFYQRLKATATRFRACIRTERLVGVLLAVACVPAVLPFTHFFTVNSHEREVSEAFHTALGEVMPMFDEYDSIANQRIENYQKTLKKAMTSKQRRKKYGFDSHTAGKPSGGDTIMLANMVETLRMQLLSPAHDSLRSEAEAWIGKAKGATTWNVYLLGNARQIRSAVDDWQQSMADALSVRLTNESVADTAAFSSVHCQTTCDQLDRVTQLCSDRAFPPFYAILLFIGSWLLLFFPHWLQNRHSKSWEYFWGKSLTKLFTKKNSPRFDVDKIVTVPVDLEHKNEVGFSLPDTPARKFSRRMAMDSESQTNSRRDTCKYLFKRIESGLTTPQLMGLIKEDHNLFDADTIKTCLERNIFFEETLTGLGVNEEFVKMLGSTPKEVLPDAQPITQLDGDSTQVFLWGLPSAGKTCAVGTILAALREKKIAKNVIFDDDCQGKEYRLMLEKIFPGDGKMCVLPGRTPVANNFAIQMSLEDYNGRIHPVTLIDMAGELFCTLVWKTAQYSKYITDKHIKARDEFEKVLLDPRAEHQKIHIFIIEYGAQDREYKGFSQDVYLDIGLQYLEEKEVLKHSTQGIYVLVTKTDQVRQNLAEGEDETTHLRNYLMTYYGNFLQTLDGFCHDYELCGGQLPAPIPFDIGEVCFSNFCKLSTRRAEDAVRLILGKSKGFRKGWLGRVERFFNK